MGGGMCLFIAGAACGCWVRVMRVLPLTRSAPRRCVTVVRGGRRVRVARERHLLEAAVPAALLLCHAAGECACSRVSCSSSWVAPQL